MVKMIFDNVDLEKEDKVFYPYVELRIASGEENDPLVITEVVEMFRSFLRSVGFSEFTINEYVAEEGRMADIAQIRTDFFKMFTGAGEKREGGCCGNCKG